MKVYMFSETMSEGGEKQRISALYVGSQFRQVSLLAVVGVDCESCDVRQLQKCWCVFLGLTSLASF